MTRPILHPRQSRLRAFAAGDMATSDRRKIGEHLLRCGKCKRYVALVARIRAYREPIGADYVPTEDVFQTIITRRAAGGRVILPSGYLASRMVTGYRRLAVAAVAVVVLVGASVLVVYRSVGGSRNTLEFSPRVASRGAVANITYRPVAALAPFDTLLLRARMRAVHGLPYNRAERMQVVATLTPRHGQFRGQLVLPDSVVYAVYSVGTADGRLVDANGGRLWEFVRVDKSGKPLLSALEQKLNDLYGRSWDEMWQTAQQMAELYPDYPQGWSNLIALQPEMAVGQSDSMEMSRYRAMGSRVEAQWRSAKRASADAMKALRALSVNQESRRYWRTRLVVEHPRDPYVLFLLQDSVMRLYSGNVVTAREYLEFAERLWSTPRRKGAADATWVSNALTVARQSGDAAAYVLWLERRLGLGDVAAEARLRLIATMADRAALRDRALTLLQGERERLDTRDENWRPLELNRAQDSLYVDEIRSEIVVLRARLLARMGKTRLAAAIVRVPAMRGWHPGAMRAYAEIALALGDTLAALQQFARASADLLSDQEFSDSVSHQLGRRFDYSVWQQYRARGRRELAKVPSGGAHTAASLFGVSIRGPHGEDLSIAKLQGGRPAVMMVWSAQNGGTLRHLAAADTLMRQLSNAGVPFMSVVTGPRSEPAKGVIEKHALARSTYWDARGELKRVLRNFVTPSYYVLDGAGRVIFATTEWHEVERRVVAILPP